MGLVLLFLTVVGIYLIMEVVDFELTMFVVGIVPVTEPMGLAPVMKLGGIILVPGAGSPWPSSWLEWSSSA